MSSTASTLRLVQGLKWLWILNVTQKLITFVLNQLLVRWTTPAIFGVAAIQLELLLSTLLFLSREGIRLALLREKITNTYERQMFINLSWLPSLLLLMVTLAMSLRVFLLSGNAVVAASTEESPSLLVILLYCIGALFESMGEPWFNIYQNQAAFTPRMRADTAATFVRSFVTFFCVACLDLKVLGFGFAQLSFGATHLFFMILHTSTSLSGEQAGCLSDFLPRLAISPSPTQQQELGKDVHALHWTLRIVHHRTLFVAVTATCSSILKHFLTEADKIVLYFSQSSYDQGIFAMANNYGSLVARIIFLPIEDSAKVFFSRLVIENQAGGEERASYILGQLLRFVALLGIIFPMFGPFYVQVMVQYIIGKNWQSREFVGTLQAFCFYLFSLALNGVSEAFVHAVAPVTSFARINVGLVVSTIIYVLVAVPMVHLVGTSGVVIAGTCSMLVRITSSFFYIQSHFSSSSNPNIRSPIASVVPSSAATLLFVCTTSVCYYSSCRFSLSASTTRDAIEHIAIGAFAFISFIALCLSRLPHKDREFLFSIVTIKRAKKD